MGRTVITRVPAQGFVCSCVYFFIFLLFTFVFGNIAEGGNKDHHLSYDTL